MIALFIIIHAYHETVHCSRWPAVTLQWDILFNGRVVICVMTWIEQHSYSWCLFWTILIVQRFGSSALCCLWKTSLSLSEVMSKSREEPLTLFLIALHTTTISMAFLHSSLSFPSVFSRTCSRINSLWTSDRLTVLFLS